MGLFAFHILIPGSFDECFRTEEVEHACMLTYKILELKLAGRSVTIKRSWKPASTIPE